MQRLMFSWISINESAHNILFQKIINRENIQNTINLICT